MKRSFPALALGTALAFFSSFAWAESEETVGARGDANVSYRKSEGQAKRPHRAPASMQKKDKREKKEKKAKKTNKKDKAKKQKASKKNGKKTAKKSSPKQHRKQAKKSPPPSTPAPDHSNEAAAPAPDGDSGSLAIDPVGNGADDLPAAKDSL